MPVTDTLGGNTLPETQNNAEYAPMLTGYPTPIKLTVGSNYNLNS